MKDFLFALLGAQTGPQFCALIFFALFAATLSLLLQTTGRNIESSSPKQFCWRFFIQDNWRRCLTALMLIYLALRFTPELLGVELNEWWAVTIGLSTDRIAQFLKDKTNLLGQKKES